MDVAQKSLSRQKNASITRAAEQLFLKYGYGGVSMDAIARRANVSKQTLYTHFTNKQQLFVGVIEALVNGLSLGDLPEPVDAGIFKKNLHIFAERLSQTLMQPDYLDMVRIIIAAVPTHPSLAETFRHKVPEQALEQLTEMLQAAKHHNVVFFQDAQVTARLFIGALMTQIILNGLLRPAPTREPIPLKELDDLCAEFLMFVKVN